jgi:hypothetical protein
MEHSAARSFGYMLASRRDAPAGLIQWGDDPCTTRHGLRSPPCFEAHSFWVTCLFHSRVVSSFRVLARSTPRGSSWSLLKLRVVPLQILEQLRQKT